MTEIEAALILKEEVNRRNKERNLPLIKHVGISLVPDCDVTEEEMRAEIIQVLDAIERGEFREIEMIE